MPHILISTSIACGELTLLVTTQIKSREAVVTNGQLLRGGVSSGRQDGDTVVLGRAVLSSAHATNLPSIYPSMQNPQAHRPIHWKYVAAMHQVRILPALGRGAASYPAIRARIRHHI